MPWLWALALPFAAAAVQWTLWPFLQPFVWFLFYPAVFAAAWIDARRGALLATTISIAIVLYAFVPPQFTFTVNLPSAWFASGVFLLMGIAFGETQIRLHRVEEDRRRLAEQESAAMIDHERRQREEESRANEVRFQQIVEGLPQLVWTCLPDGSCDFLSRQWVDYTGVPLEQQLGSGWVEAIHPDDRAGILAAWEEAVVAGASYRYEVRLRRADGAYRWFEANAVPLRDADGRITRWFGATGDIQEARDARLELARQARLLELAYDPIIAWSEDRGIEFWNRGAEQLYGFPVREALGQVTHHLLQTRFPQTLQAALDALHRDGTWSGELRQVTQGGRPLIVMTRLQTVELAGRTLVLEANRDVTAERANLEQMRRWADAFTYCTHGMAMGLPGTNTILACNPAFARLMNMPVDRLVGQPIVNVYVPGDRARVREQIAVADATGGAQYEVTLASAGAAPVPVQVDVASVRDETGAVIYRIATFQNIRERREAESQIKTLAASLEQKVAERTAELNAANAELESFAYAVSHDLRAPLRAMSGFSTALVEDYGAKLDGEAHVYLEQIVRGARQMADLIDGLLTLSRSTRGGIDGQSIDLSGLATELWAKIREADPTRIVVFEVEPGLTAWGDPRMLKIVLQNLLENAWKYTSRTAAARVHLGAAVADDAAFFVEDNGAGFDMAHAAKLFQPFQRLHRQEEFTGTGIGLATVQRIIHRHGGTVQAAAAVGRGARFTFTLPRPVRESRL